MNYLKRIIALLLCLALLVGFTGCSSGGNTTPSSDNLLDKAVKLLNAEGREYDKLYTGQMNETLICSFFEFSITSANVTDTLADYMPQTDGYQFLVADVTAKNIFGDDIPVGNYDFYIMWNGGEDIAYESFMDDMYPDEVVLKDGESLSGKLVFELPPDASDIMIGYTEVWEDNFKGNIYLVEIKL